MIEELNRSVREDIPMQEVLCGWPDTYSKPPSPTWPIDLVCQL